MPGATSRQLMRASRRILSACDGKDHSIKISPAQLQELVMANWHCVDRSCPACFFWEPMSRAINEFFGEERKKLAWWGIVMPDSREVPPT